MPLPISFGSALKKSANGVANGHAKGYGNGHAIDQLHSALKPANGVANDHENGHVNAPADVYGNGHPIKWRNEEHNLEPRTEDQKTDRYRWRLVGDHGCHTWYYLTNRMEEHLDSQSTADKFHLGLPTVGPV